MSEVRRTSQRSAVVAFGSSLLVFGLLAAAVTTRHADGWDAAALRLVRPLPRRLDPDLLLLGGLALCGIGVGWALLALAFRRQLLRGLFVLAAVGGAVGLDPVLKGVFRRPAINPADHGYSFPSGSAMISAAAVVALILLISDVRRRLAVALIGVSGVVLYGVAIVAARWHYASDVIAGWTIAVAWVTALWLLALRRFVPPRATRP